MAKGYWLTALFLIGDELFPLARLQSDFYSLSFQGNGHDIQTLRGSGV